MTEADLRRRSRAALVAQMAVTIATGIEAGNNGPMHEEAVAKRAVAIARGIMREAEAE